MSTGAVAAASPDISLAGLSAVVTGAGRGIGAAIARALVAAGASVALAARSKQELEAVASELETRGGSVVALPTDVTDPKAVQRLIEGTLDSFGRLDIAVNNAGAGHAPTPLTELSDEGFESVLRTNLLGVFYCMKWEIPAMTSTGGSIINVSSRAGIVGVAGLADYSAAKHGLIGLTRSAALECAPDGIRVNALAPGPIRSGGLALQTEEVQALAAQPVPLARIGAPEEVAAAALWLCSSQSSFLTGCVIPVDGGLGAK
jgi:NAD(P)-dependent dehydrogenase (short-subunit alcohol dehydrogenase family)